MKMAKHIEKEFTLHFEEPYYPLRAGRELLPKLKEFLRECALEKNERNE